MTRHVRPSRAGAGRAVALVLAALALAALPGASATDYAGDYALYSGYHSGCAPVALGIEGPGFNVTGGEVDVTKEGVLYARFHVRTPDAYLSTRASAGPATVNHDSTYYTMFVLGGDAASERGVGGFFGGYKVAGDGTDPTEGVLFFGVRGATVSEDVVLGEELSTTRARGGLNGEATKVEFAFERGSVDANVASLSIYADGQLVFENSTVNMSSVASLLTSGPLAVGAGGHNASSAFVDAFDAGGCFSPNLPGWTRDAARRPGEPAGELACGARNKWGERDGGDVLWCPPGWLGEPPGAAATTKRAAFDPREHDCQVVAHARAAPMYSAAVPSAESEAWQRNNLPLGDETANYDGGHVNLRRLGMQPLDSRVGSGGDWWGDAFAYARFRFTTPEHFDRPSEAWRIEAPDATRSGEAGKIRLMSLDQDVAVSNDGSTKVFKEGGVCVSLFPVFPDGRRFSSVRQHNNRSKVVLHACGESVPESNYELDRPDALLEPSTAYLLEIKFNFRKSSKSVQVFLQGELVDEAPFDLFPCKLNGGDSDHKCWSKTDDIPHVVAFGDNSHHVDEFDWHGVEGFYDPLEFVGGGGVGAYRTSWGGVFSEPFNPRDDSCSRDGRCYRLTSPEGTWGEWRSGELHFCPYPSPLDAPRPPNVDVETFRAELACVGCYPRDESVGEALLGAVLGLDEMEAHGGVANDEIFRVLSATMGGADAKDANGDPSPAGFVKMRGGVVADPNRAAFLFWTCEGASNGVSTLLMQAVTFVATNVSVSATSAGARKVAADAGEASACSGEETGWDVLESWMSASAAASSPTAATGLNEPGFGVHSIVAEVFVPAKVASASAKNDAWTLGWKTFEPVAARVSGNVSAGDVTEYPFSVVHVLARGEAESGDAACAGTDGPAYAHDPACAPFFEFSDDVQSSPLGANVVSSTTFSADGVYYARFDMQHADSNSGQTLLLWGGDSSGCGAWHVGIKADGTMFMESKCQTSDSVSSTGALTHGAYYFLEFYYDSATSTARMWKLCDEFCAQDELMGEAVEVTLTGGQDATLILSAGPISVGYAAHDASDAAFAGTMIQLEVYDCPQAPAGRRRSLLRAPSEKRRSPSRASSSSSSAFSRFGAMSGSSPVPSGTSRGASRSLLNGDDHLTYPTDSAFCEAFVPKAICEGAGAQFSSHMCDTAYGCSWDDSTKCSMSTDDSATFEGALSGWFPAVDTGSACNGQTDCSATVGCFFFGGACFPIPSTGVTLLSDDGASAVIQTYYHSLRQSEYCMDMVSEADCSSHAGCHVVDGNCQYAAEFGVWEVVTACEAASFAFTPEEKDSIAVASFKSDWTGLLSFLSDNSLDSESRYTINTGPPSGPPVIDFPTDYDFCAAFGPKAICEGNGAKSFDHMCDTTTTEYGCSWVATGTPPTCSMSSGDSTAFDDVLSGWFPAVDTGSACDGLTDTDCSPVDGCFFFGGACFPIPSTGVTLLSDDGASAVIQTYYHSLRQSEYCMDMVSEADCSSHAGCHVVDGNCQYAAEFGVWEVVTACEAASFAFTPEEKDSIAVASFKSDWTGLLSFLSDNSLDSESRYTINTGPPSGPPVIDFPTDYDFCAAFGPKAICEGNGAKSFDHMCDTTTTEYGCSWVATGTPPTCSMSSGDSTAFDDVLSGWFPAVDTGSACDGLTDTDCSPVDGCFFFGGACFPIPSTGVTLLSDDGASAVIQTYYHSLRQSEYCMDMVSEADCSSHAGCHVVDGNCQYAAEFGVWEVVTACEAASFAFTPEEKDSIAVASFKSDWTGLLSFLSDNSLDSESRYTINTGPPSGPPVIDFPTDYDFCAAFGPKAICEGNGAKSFDHMCDTTTTEYGCSWVATGTPPTCSMSSGDSTAFDDVLSGWFPAVDTGSACDGLTDTDCSPVDGCFFFGGACFPIPSTGVTLLSDDGASAVIQTYYHSLRQSEYCMDMVSEADCSSHAGCHVVDGNCQYAAEFGVWEVVTACEAASFAFTPEEKDSIAVASFKSDWTGLLSFLSDNSLDSESRYTINTGPPSGPPVIDFPTDYDFCAAFGPKAICEGNGAKSFDHMCDTTTTEYGCSWVATGTPPTCSMSSGDSTAFDDVLSGWFPAVDTGSACDGLTDTDCSPVDGCFFFGGACFPIPSTGVTLLSDDGASAVIQTYYHSLRQSEYCMTVNDMTSCPTHAGCHVVDGNCQYAAEFGVWEVVTACEEAANAFGISPFTDTQKDSIAVASFKSDWTDLLSFLSGHSLDSASRYTIDTGRDALAATCQYAAAFPDLSSPATLVVVRLNVTISTEGTSVTHIGTSVTENVDNCHYVSQDRDTVLDGWRCGARVTGPDPFAVTGLLVREAPRAGASAPRAPLTGPELLSRRDFEGECERPELYERFGFTNLRSVSDSAARTAALAAS